TAIFVIKYGTPTDGVAFVSCLGSSYLCVPPPAYEGSSCVLMGKTYLNGESFQPKRNHTSFTFNLWNLFMDVLLPISVYRNRFAPKPELKLKSILNDLQVNCLVQTTEWSVCSKTCGLGISTCVTNDNPQCQLEKESRLCNPDNIGICIFFFQKGKRCLQNPKSHEAINFEFIGCTSVHSYWPKSCGSLEVEFQCPEGESFVRKMMFIKSCSFHFDCPAGNDVFLGSYHQSVVEDHFKLKNQ
uniref:CCN TSP1 domain-containing protein n=1 Tax=Laticauda laticaudata TaxID=8630 RepID=A0A8C5WXA1_LATLA